jgi:muconolactone delta-isomerase
MLLLQIADIVKPPGMSDKEFYQIWKEESDGALPALESGDVVGLWKAAGQYKIVCIIDPPDGDALDRSLHEFAIWKSGHHEMIQNLQLIPLREYKGWAEDLKGLVENAE